jgi:hypothetical protein
MANTRAEFRTQYAADHNQVTHGRNKALRACMLLEIKS